MTTADEEDAVSKVVVNGIRHIAEDIIVMSQGDKGVSTNIIGEKADVSIGHCVTHKAVEDVNSI